MWQRWQAKIRQVFTEKQYQTPVVLQMEAAECGAAALSIILAHYKLYVPLEELRIHCGVSRDGCNALNILKAARHYGMLAEGISTDIESLKQLKWPCILFWSFNHFVVLEHMTDEAIYINDPANGRRSISFKEFDQCFTGVVLTMEPGSHFQKGGTRYPLFKRLKNRVDNNRHELLFIFLASIAVVLPQLINAGFSQIFIDEILVHHMDHWLAPLLTGLIVTTIIRSLLSWLQEFYLLRIQIKFFTTFSSELIWHVFRLPFSFFQQRLSGDINARLEAPQRLSSLLSGELIQSAVNILSIALYLLCMLLYNASLTCIVLFITTITLCFLTIFIKKLSQQGRLLLQAEGELRGIEISGLFAMETLKATHQEQNFFQCWTGYQAKVLNAERPLQMYLQILHVFPFIADSVLTMAILLAGSYQIMHGNFTIGSLIAFQSLAANFNAPLHSLLSLGDKLQQVQGDLARVGDILQHSTDPRLELASASSPSIPLAQEGEIEFRNVSFSYSPLDPPLLHDVSFKIAPKRCIGIVGATGSGKSTLARLMVGLYPPLFGDVLLHGALLKEISPDALAESVALVEQDISLFDGTLRDNVTLWDNSLSDHQIQDAIQNSCLQPLIDSRSQTLNTSVQEGGLNFSGGQRQQIDIARALVKKPSILILDEATSSLDANTEDLILKNLQQRSYTMIMIAHRLSTVRHCDEIFVIDQGTIVERGTHEALLSQKGVYYKLVSEV